MFFPKIRGLQKSDQLIAGLGVSIFLASAVFYFWQRSITNGGLIEFEDLPSRQVSYVVDINAAPWPEFANLPGIGEKLARQIVSHREKFGPFDRVQQLTDIAGIGPAKLEAILPFLSLNDRKVEDVNENQH